MLRRIRLSAFAMMAIAGSLGWMVASGHLAETLAQDKADPLPSWNDGPNKKAIMDFVAKVTKEGSPDFVPKAERIATFDNDGTLWCEQPMPVQLYFALDRVKASRHSIPNGRKRSRSPRCLRMI